MTRSDEDRRSVSAVIEQYRRGFATMDPKSLQDLWDPTYDSLVYVASERVRPITNWTGIRDYYEQLPAGLPPNASVQMHVDEVTVDVVGDIAHALCIFHYEGPVQGQSEPFIADGRVTFIMLRRQDSWKVVHYHESSPGTVG